MPQRDTIPPARAAAQRRGEPRPDDAALTLALAPMEGVTDEVVRETFGELGALDYCVSEFVRVSENVLGARALLRLCPELAAGGRTSHGLPVHLQLLGGDPERVARSAAVAVELGATVVDLNFGCPAPTVNRHDGGATLLKDPRRVEAVTAAVRAALPASVPVSAKVRLGWDDPDDVVTIVRAAEAGGAAWITVHGRTRAQGYAPPADWARIGLARAAVRVPVVANGDVCSPADLARCRDLTGCARVMVGRGAVARPELFRVLRGLEPGFWPAWRRVAVLERFCALSLARGAERERVTLSRLKQWARALAGAEPLLAPLFETLKRLEAVDPARALLDRTRDSLARRAERGDEPPARASAAAPPPA